VPIFRRFLGGVPGGGKQWVSWVHIEDVCRAIRFLAESKAADGVYNLTAPAPVRAKAFYHILGEVMGRPAFFSPPGFVLRLTMGEMARELILSSQRAMPEKLLQVGYTFTYPEARAALENVIQTMNEKESSE